MADSVNSERGTRGKAEELGDRAQERAQEATHQARGWVRTQLDRRSSEVAGRVESSAGDVRSVAEQLREQGKDQPARLAERVADRTDRVGYYLRDADADRMLADVEDFGRRQPWAIALGGLLIGFGAARFLKASSADRYRDSAVRTHELGDGRESAAGLGAPSGQVPPAPAAAAPRTGT